MTVTEDEEILDASKTDLAFTNMIQNFGQKLYPII